MKKLTFVFVLVFMMSAILASCVTNNEITDTPETSVDTKAINTSVDAETTSTPIDTEVPGTSVETETEAAQNGISKDMAYEGVSNYCHSEYDWSIAENNPDIMYLTMGEETESEYQVIFRSYTGSFVYFYVDKSSGTTRLTEYVPALDIEEEAGNINLYDYLESAEK